MTEKTPSVYTYVQACLALTYLCFDIKGQYVRAIFQVKELQFDLHCVLTNGKGFSW